MKRILFLVLLFVVATAVKAQYPVTQFLGSDSAMVKSMGGFKARLINYPFTDTTQANTQRISQYAGALIYTTSGGDKLWLRNSTATAWDRIGTSSGGGGGIVSLGASAYGLIIQNDSTYKADTIQLSTRLWRQKGIDSVQENLRTEIGLKFSLADTSLAFTPYVRTPGGTAGLIPRWIDSRTMGNSSILYDNGTNAGATATFLAPSMKSATSTHYYSFRVDGNLGMGEVFSDGSYIQRMILAGYHYIQSVNPPANGLFLGVYPGQSYINFKNNGRMSFDTLGDVAQRFYFKGSGRFTDSLFGLTLANLADSSDVVATTKWVKEQNYGAGFISNYPTSVSYNQATQTLSIARNLTSDITTTLPEVTTSLAGLQSAADKAFIDSIRAGQITDSVYYRLIVGPTTHDSAYVYVNTYNNVLDSALMFLIPKSSGSVSGGIANVGTSDYGLITQNDSTYKVDTALLSTKLWRQKGIDSLQGNINLKFNTSDTANKWVTSIYRKTGSDSVFYVKGGVATFAYKDSIGTGGGGSTTYKIGTYNAYSSVSGASIVADSIYMQAFSAESPGLVPPGGGSPGQTLRGDATWGYAPTVYKVTSDVTSPASTAYSDITGLSFTATSGVTYVIDAVISVKVDATTTGAKFAINGPASPTFVSTSYFYPTTSSALGINNHSTYDAASATTGTATLSAPLWFRATIKTSSTGTVALRFGSEIATASSVTINAGSYMSVMSSN